MKGPLCACSAGVQGRRVVGLSVHWHTDAQKRLPEEVQSVI